MRDLFGCNLSAATVHRAGNVCSGKLVRCEQRIKAAIRDPAVVGVDETGLRVTGGSDWVDVARTENHTHYVYNERRGKAAMELSLPLIISFLAPTDLSKRGDLCQSFLFWFRGHCRGQSYSRRVWAQRNASRRSAADPIQPLTASCVHELWYRRERVLKMVALIAAGSIVPYLVASYRG